MSLLFNPLSSNFDYSPPTFSLNFKPINSFVTLKEGGLFLTSFIGDRILIDCSKLKQGAYLNWQNVSLKSVILTGLSEINGVSIASDRGINIAAGTYLEGFISGNGNISGAGGKFKVIGGNYSITLQTLPTDPLSDLVIAYLNGQSFTDLSPNPKAITNTNVSLNNSTKKYGNSSLYFNGNSNLVLNLGGPTFNLQTAVGCIECWVYITNYFTFASAGSNFIDFYWQFDNVNYLGDGIGNPIAGDNTPQNQWAHLALTFSSNTWKWYQNGILKHTTAGLKNYNVSSIKIGGRNTNNSTGFLGAWRCTIGNIRYNANFDPTNLEQTYFYID